MNYLCSLGHSVLMKLSKNVVSGARAGNSGRIEIQMVGHGVPLSKAAWHFEPPHQEQRSASRSHRKGSGQNREWIQNADRRYRRSVEVQHAEMPHYGTGAEWDDGWGKFDGLMQGIMKELQGIAGRLNSRREDQLQATPELSYLIREMYRSSSEYNMMKLARSTSDDVVLKMLSQVEFRSKF